LNEGILQVETQLKPAEQSIMLRELLQKVSACAA